MGNVAAIPPKSEDRKKAHTPEAHAKRRATFVEAQVEGMKAAEGLGLQPVSQKRVGQFKRKMPNGQYWHVWVKQHQDELVEAAARIAVDMERGLIVDPMTNKPFDSYVKRRIFDFLEVEGMRFEAVLNRGPLPLFMNEPFFSRAVEWERVKRDHSYRIAFEENLPVMKAIYGGMTMEIARRVYVDPHGIPDNVLFPEWRKIGVMLAEVGGARIPENINIIINNFREEVSRMPEETREAALAIFRTEIRSLVAGSKEAENIIDAEIAAADKAS